MKIVINKSFGGFSLSDKAVELYFEKKGEEASPDFSNYYMNRTDTVLVDVVETLGAEADGQYAELAVVEIPDGISYVIDEYDGMEHIAERHRTWH
jgi:hypothetical protein